MMFMESINVIKVGGAVVEDAASLAVLLDRFAKLEGNKVLVHGGGRSATKLAAQLGIETQMIDGRRVTDADMLRVVMMVYGGLVNKNVVAALQSRGINALGLTGADLNVIRAHKRPLKNGIDYGCVGDIDSADGQMLATLIGEGIVPVMAPLSHDGQGSMLNVNADTIAATTAKALAPHFEVTLTYCFEKAGVLANPDDDASVISHIDNADFRKYVEDGTISGGMIPKIENALNAIACGVKRVIITSSSSLDGAGGTVIE